ncbi:MAG: hypothetical protein IKR19_07770 [Acholeplasmatales bacterium]|nr:hypothetical protein [Acholeplasmatales bacterium]
MEINYDEIDEEIRTAVYNFNLAGYETIFSCQGHNDDEKGVVCPYLTIKLPYDNTMTGFILNNITPIMHITIRVPASADDVKEVTDEESGETFFVTDTDKFLSSHTSNDFVLGIYLNSYIPEDKDSFDRLRKMFIDDLTELSKYLVTLSEVYKQCC